MSFFRKSSRYPPLYEKPPAWREFGLEGVLIFLSAFIATASLIDSVITHEAFLMFTFSGASSSVDSFSAKFDKQPILFCVLTLFNILISVGGWWLIGAWIKRRLDG